MRKRSVRQALELIHTDEEEYKELITQPEGCIEILRYYLPHCEERSIPFDKLVQRVDFHFFKIIEELLDQKNYDDYGKYLRSYNSLFDVYGIPLDVYQRFRNSRSKRTNKICGDEMEFAEPSDLELTLISRGVR